MSPSFVSIDNSADLDMGPPAPKATGAAGSKRTLVLAPPSIAMHEDKLRDLFSKYDRAVTDLQMLDRVSAGFVSLPADAYETVLVLTDDDGARHKEALQLLRREVFTAVVPAMKVGGRLQTQDGIFGDSETREAVLAGLANKDGGFVKMDDDEGVVVPLKLGGKKNGSAKPAPAKLSLNDLDDNDDDEIIDEETLMTEADLTRPIVQRECQQH